MPDLPTIEKHLTAEDTITAIELLAANTDLSKAKLKKAMTNGAAWLEDTHGIHRIRRAKKQLKTGEMLHLYYDESIQAQTPQVAVLISDEGDYSIWNKPTGMYSQGSKWGDHCTLYRWAEQHLDPQRPAYLVHRLDRAANGLMVIAHNKKTAAAFADMFKRHDVIKHYQAVVEGDITAITPPHTIDTAIDDRPAESIIIASDYDEDDGTSSVRIKIVSGRKHQVRRHLASLGHPIVGDRLYGARDISKDLQLTSMHLAFDCPVTGRHKKWILACQQ